MKQLQLPNSGLVLIIRNTHFLSCDRLVSVRETLLHFHFWNELFYQNADIRSENSLFLFFINYFLFCTFDMKLSTSNNRGVLVSLFLLISSSTLAWYLISRHDTVCDQSAIHLNISALFQIVCLLSKCSLDHFYLSKYGYIKIKVI